MVTITKRHRATVKSRIPMLGHKKKAGKAESNHAINEKNKKK